MENQNKKQPSTIPDFGTQLAMNVANKLKKHVLTIELFSAVVFAFGLFLKHSDKPGSTFLIAIPLIILAMLNYFLAFANYKYDESSGIKIVILLKYLIFWGRSIALMGILFLIVQWPGGNNMLIAGFITLIIGFFGSLIYKLKGNECEIFSFAELLRSVVILLLTVGIYYFYFYGSV